MNHRKTDPAESFAVGTFPTVLRDHTTHTIWPISASRVLVLQHVGPRNQNSPKLRSFSMATKNAGSHKADIPIPNRIETSLPAQFAKLVAHAILAIRRGTQRKTVCRLARKAKKCNHQKEPKPALNQMRTHDQKHWGSLAESTMDRTMQTKRTLARRH